MTQPDFKTIKTRQQMMWSSGDYGIVGTTLQVVGENLVDACGCHHGDAVLDVAAGNGNATLAAARIGCDVTSTDYVPELLQQGKRRADAERLDVAFQAADAEDLPFAEASFAGVLSTFGVMFAPDHAKAAAEMLRVCRPGGRIGLANWTPEGLIGRVFGVLGKHVPPPAGVLPPPKWGVESHLADLFGAGAKSIDVTRCHFNFRYRSPEHFVEVFRNWYGPIQKAFGAAESPARLEADLVDLLNEVNVGGPGTLVAPSEYLQVVITRA
jgi:SAM-dependent methyltransferase